ncbi:MAG: glycosyltransferase family 4 protein [Planctomycetes bacterium]|nr:glycosyltransferase family 4 protein [Planctomycetota bacterium]
MKILYTNFHKGWGGQPLQVLLLAKAMAARGHEVVVFAPPKSELAARAQAAGLAVDTACHFRKGFHPQQFTADMKTLRHRLKESGAEIIHSHGSQDTWVAATAILGRSIPALLVRTKHNSYPTKRHMANRWLYHHAVAKTIAVAGPIREELIANDFIAPDRVVVIHAGLRDGFASDVKKSREEVRAEFGIRADAPLVGLVGRLAPDKGQETLLQAAIRIRPELPGAKFLLVGTGGDWDRLRGLIAAYALQETVIWAGFQEDIPSITAALDISVLAAKSCDASSTVVKEAMALGVPVVATSVGGTAEILDGGACGLLVRPGSAQELADAILRTFSNPEETASRVGKARERVKQYFASIMAERTEALYREEIEKKQALLARRNL